MTHTHDIRRLQEQAGASFLTYGEAGGDDAAAAPQLVETFGEYEAEYAAIRKGVGIFDMPQRGLVAVTGKDRAEFLHRMITHDTRALQPGHARRAFLLSKAGRIDADLIVLATSDAIWIDLDHLHAPGIVRDLDKYLFSEDVKLRDISEQHHHIALHGPQGLQLLEALGGGAAPLAPLAPMQHASTTLAGAVCVVYRRDDTGSPGLHVLAPAPAAGPVYGAMATPAGGLLPEAVLHAVGRLSKSSEQTDLSLAVQQLRQRPILGRGIGWLAYNTARIEAGVPLFHIDFGPDSLPGETAVLHDAVSFTKGCYLGQEIVARMHNLGHPKRMVVGLRCEDDRLPVAGSQVFDGSAADAGPGPGQVIGAVTSSTLSPLLGNTAIALATVKWGKHVEGTVVRLPAEGEMVKATVAALPFIKMGESA